MTISAIILADSLHPNGSRLTTFQLRYPRFIHAELMTHRAMCVSGDALLDFDLPGATKRGDKQLQQMTVRSFVDKWLNGAAEGVSSRHNGVFLRDVLDGSVYSAKTIANLLGMESDSNLNGACRSGAVPNAFKQGRKWYALGCDWKRFRESTGLRRFSLRDRLSKMNIRQVDEITGKVRHAHVKSVIKSGIKEVFRLTAGDYSVVASADHRILTIEGWKQLKDIIPGQSKVLTYRYGSGANPDPFRKIDGVWVCKWAASVRDQVAVRQGHRCHETGEDLREGFHIHHVIPRHQRPDLAFDLSNVVAINEEAHREVHRIQGWQKGVMIGSDYRLVESVTPEGVVDTYDLEIDGPFPNFFADGIVVHNSRNASSSRAIPVAKFLSAMREEPAMPEVWYKNKPGMQGTELMTEAEIKQAKAIIGIMRDTCAAGIDALDKLGLHKQTANRYGEPWHHISVIISGTEWANFFALRDHPDAQPEFGILARTMRKVYDENKPTALKEGQYHLPYISPAELEDLGIESALKCSVARCARVSFNNHDGTAPNWVKDVELHDKLVVARPLHASPAEHQACVLNTQITSDKEKHLVRGNFALGWCQYRKTLAHENVDILPPKPV